MTRKAFTLVELLVVVAIIVILIAILMPGLEKAMDLAQRAKCLSQTKLFAMSWRIYAQDNMQFLVGPQPGYTIYDWVGLDTGFTAYTPETFHSPDRVETGVVNVYGVPNMGTGDGTGGTYDPTLQESAIIYPPFYKYVGAVKAYKCPTDPRSTYIRSYSMNDQMGGYNSPNVAKNLGALSKASDTVVFLEENDIGPRAYRDRNYNCNLGSWVANYWQSGVWGNPEYWGDPIAEFHRRAGNLSFADGHAETREFKKENTWKVGAWEFNSYGGGNNEDLLYYQRAYWLQRP